MQYAFMRNPNSSDSKTIILVCFLTYLLQLVFYS